MIKDQKGLCTIEKYKNLCAYTQHTQTCGLVQTKRGARIWRFMKFYTVQEQQIVWKFPKSTQLFTWI